MWIHSGNFDYIPFHFQASNIVPYLHCRNNFLKIQLFYGDISYNSLEQSPAYDVEALLSMYCLLVDVY